MTIPPTFLFSQNVKFLVPVMCPTKIITLNIKESKQDDFWVIAAILKPIALPGKVSVVACGCHKRVDKAKGNWSRFLFLSTSRYRDIRRGMKGMRKRTIFSLLCCFFLYILFFPSKSLNCWFRWWGIWDKHCGKLLETVIVVLITVK